MTDSRPDRGDEEVDDVVTTLMTNTPDTGPSLVTARQAYTAPNWSEQGTGVSSAGGTGPSVHGLGMRTRSSSTPVQVAFGARVIDLPGSPPRGAPV